MTPFPTTNRAILLTLATLFILLGGFCVTAQDEEGLGSTAFTYTLDYIALKQVGTDLYDNLKPKHQVGLSPSPIWVQEDEKPYVRPYLFESENEPTRVIYLSEGFVWFTHYLAHAIAIDKTEPGFLQGYLERIATASEDKLLPEPPQISARKYWSPDLINEQVSYFNQIIAGVCAIEMAHHYLGHYDKYAGQLRDSVGNPSTMAMACSASQWESSMKLGAANALDCGYGFEGLKTLYDCIGTMPNRPRWTLYFLPPVVDIKKVKKDLDKIEAGFFGQ